jgi:hypothetical protein
MSEVTTPTPSARKIHHECNSKDGKSCGHETKMSKNGGLCESMKNCKSSFSTDRAQRSAIARFKNNPNK